jgi:hypothetical protein
MLFQAGPRRFFASFLTHLCTVLLLVKPCGLLMGALFWQQDMPRPVPLHKPPRGPKKVARPPSLKYMTISYCSHQPISMGKFRIQPCSRALPNGAFGAQVSVASGRGSASTDRVMRFLPEFATPAAASQYALDEGMLWVERQTTKPILL